MVLPAVPYAFYRRPLEHQENTGENKGTGKTQGRKIQGQTGTTPLHKAYE
jgi:hypothetical protein